MKPFKHVKPQPGIVAKARAWAAVKTACGACNKVRAAAAKVIGKPR